MKQGLFHFSSDWNFERYLENTLTHTGVIWDLFLVVIKTARDRKTFSKSASPKTAKNQFLLTIRKSIRVIADWLQHSLRQHSPPHWLLSMGKKFHYAAVALFACAAILFPDTGSIGNYTRLLQAKEEECNSWETTNDDGSITTNWECRWVGEETVTKVRCWWI